MLDALSELETSVTGADNEPAGTADAIQIRNSGQRSFLEFHQYLNAAAATTALGAKIVSSDQTASRNGFGPGELATLKNIEVTLSTFELKWQVYTNCLETSPREARSIRDNFLLPILNEELRPLLTDYCQGLEHESMYQVQHALQKSQSSQQMTLLLTISLALAVLVAGVFLSRLLLEPVSQLSRAAQDVAAGNRQRRLQIKSAGKFRDMAVAFNQMLDVLQAARFPGMNWKKPSGIAPAICKTKSSCAGPSRRNCAPARNI